MTLPTSSKQDTHAGQSEQSAATKKNGSGAKSRGGATHRTVPDVVGLVDFPNQAFLVNGDFQGPCTLRCRKGTLDGFCSVGIHRIEKCPPNHGSLLSLNQLNGCIERCLKRLSPVGYEERKAQVFSCLELPGKFNVFQRQIRTNVVEGCFKPGVQFGISG